MRAYFAYLAPRTSGHKPSVIAIVPVNGFYAAFTRPFEKETPIAWRNTDEWFVQSPPEIEQVERILLAGVNAGGVPVREWSVEVPAKVYDGPLGRSKIDSPAAPLQKWFKEVLASADGTNPMVGSPIASMSAADYQEHMRRRAKDIDADALSAIALRTSSVGPKATPKVAPMKGAQTYTRPNGDTYYARKWGAHTDVEVVRKARETGQPVFLKSPPGTGKTALFEAAFGEDMYTLVGSGSTEETDLVGTYTTNPDGTFTWVDGPLLRACKEGKVFFLDEVGLIDAKVLSVVYPLMDGRDHIDVTINPAIGKVEAKKGFFIVGATNPNAPGVRLSEALLSRFDIQAEMTTDYSLLETVIGVNANICRVAANLAKKQKEGEVSWAPQFRELLAFQKTEKSFGTQFALQNMMATVPEHDRTEVQEALQGGIGELVEGAVIV